MDSMQVYRYMNIGTAKITQEEMKRVKHHLIDIADPDEEYNAAHFVEDALSCIAEIHQRGRTPLITGGTGLYLHSLKNGLFENVPSNAPIRSSLLVRIEEEGTLPLHSELKKIDPRSAERIHPHDKTRIVRAMEVYLSTGVTLSNHIARQQKNKHPHIFLKNYAIGLTCDRGELYERINMRSEQMLCNGLEEEVVSLLSRGYNESLKSMQSIGYRHMLSYLNGIWDKTELCEYLCRDTRRYAKRQFTWFNRDKDINWFEIHKPSAVLSAVDKWLNNKTDFLWIIQEFTPQSKNIFPALELQKIQR